MVVRTYAEVVDSLSEKLARGGISVKIFYQEQEFPAERLKMVQLYAGSRGYVGIPVILLMILDVDRRNWPQGYNLDSPGASELDAILY
jgi:hypothetical protein